MSTSSHGATDPERTRRPSEGDYRREHHVVDLFEAGRPRHSEKRARRPAESARLADPASVVRLRGMARSRLPGAAVAALRGRAECCSRASWMVTSKPTGRVAPWPTPRRRLTGPRPDPAPNQQRGDTSSGRALPCEEYNAMKLNHHGARITTSWRRRHVRDYFGPTAPPPTYSDNMAS